MEIYLMRSLSSNESIEKLKDCVGRFENCSVLVSDKDRLLPIVNCDAQIVHHQLVIQYNWVQGFVPYYEY